MKVQQELFSNGSWRIIKPKSKIQPSLVICFGSREQLTRQEWLDNFRFRYPQATVVSVSTSGEISNQNFSEDTIIANVIELEKSYSEIVCNNIKDFSDTTAAGTSLARSLTKENLKFILLFSDGILVNGGDLVSAFNEVFKENIPIAGGLAGDGDKFIKTVLGVNENINSGNIVAIGFYGEHLKPSWGCKGGWTHFGPTREITRADKNVLYELDGQSALELYKNYLGDYGNNLAASALHFPLSLVEEGKDPLVRTILSVDENNKTMTFAGNMPEGTKVRFMKSTHQNLIDAATQAAQQSILNLSSDTDKLTMLVSCVGRKFMMGSRIEDEIDAVRQAIGPETILTGFYSHGEIAPHTNFTQCSLHNQTITITSISESI